MAVEVVVAGLGARGERWAGEVRARPGFELAAGVDVDPGTLERTGSRLGLPRARQFTDLAEALDGTRCDSVIVATSSDHHAEPCEQALLRGLGVLVEKPFTTRLTDAVRLVALAEQREAPIVVGQNYRYMRRHRTVRRVVREGRLGRIGMAVARYYHGSAHIPAWQAAMPNSVLWGPAVHHIDALRWVMGRPITGVMAELFTSPWGALPPGASIHSMIDIEGGPRVLYSATYESSGHEFFERGQEYYERLVGERGTLHVLHRWLLLCEKGRLPRVIRRGKRSVTEEAILLDQLSRALLSGEEPDSSGRDNLQTLAALEACIRSADEGRWVDPGQLLTEAEAAAP